MIGLNKIGLNQVQLNRLRLNAPFPAYGKMAGGGGSGDGFPQLPGDVTRWHFGGLTNEMMAAMDDPRIEDADHKGRFLSFKNFAWKGMSGVGGYEMNFNLWRNNVSSIPDFSMSTTTTSVSVSVGNSTYNNNLIYIHISNWDINKNHWLKVTSTYEDGDLAFIFYNDSKTKKIGLPANGYVNILAYPEFKGSYMYISTISNKQGSFTIEQLPLYPGFILGDGVDDFAVTEKELNFEDTYTVYTAFIPFQDDPIRGMVVCGKDFKKDFYLYYSGTHLTYYTSGLNDFIPVHINQFHIIVCKCDKTNAVIKNLITGESKTFSVSELINNPGVYYLWRYYQAASYYAKAAIAGQIIANGHFTTDEEDENILNWHKKQYPWLFPNQAWTVVGKTNEDEDRATIANITGNGNDLVLSNFGFAEGSGYGSYFWNFKNFQDWNTVTEVTNSKIVLKGSASNFWGSQIVKTVGEELHIVSKVKVTGLTDEMPKLYFGKFDTGDKLQLTNGINNINKIIFAQYGWYGFGFEEAFESCNVTIEQIPEYEGYLVTDGVDDTGRAVGLTISKDFTLVGEWILFSKTSVNAGLSIHPQIHIFNQPEAIKIVFRTAGKTLPVKSLKAICSDGRCYDENWSELKINVGEFTDNKGTLFVASNGTNYAQIAFKNLGIYDNHILSKDDCIKAYNYLQTLKAK
jgi:hypothetical protein